VLVLAREPEVEHAHAPIVADDHVVGLEISMNDADGVCGGEPAPGLQVSVADVPPRALLALAPDMQRRAVDVLHRDEHLVS
jgi:hypothetical protein